MIAKRIFIAIAILLSASAEKLKADYTPFNFLRYISNARAAGLSGSYVSIADDPGAVFYNPATISTVTDRNVSFTFLKHVLDINSGNIAYIHNQEDIGTFAATIAYTSYGSFDYRNSDGNKYGGSFGANDLMFGVSYSNILDTNLYYGVTVKFAYLSLEKVATSAMAVDAGLWYQLPDERSNLGFSILHAGGQLTRIDGRKENLPLDVRIGANHRLRGLPLLANINFHHLADQTDKIIDKFKNFSIGGELYIGQYVQLRLGYNNHIRIKVAKDTGKGMTGFSGGIGINVDSFNFDYGYNQFGSNANIHRFSILLDL